MDKKSRDDPNVRKAIKELGIESHLWLKSLPNGQEYMPAASYSMSEEDKERFLNVLQKLRVPDGYGSDLSRCVNMKQRKLMNMKNHDNHVLMQDILPIALRASNATKVIDLLAKFSSFFKKLCSTTLNPIHLDILQDEIILTLCEMEMKFLPLFFTIMVHLLIHLVDEAKLGGLVQYRWMYPIERFLAHLKSHVTNKAQPEGSIAEGYSLEETIMFCCRFLEGVKTFFNRPKRIEDGIPNSSNYLYNSGGRVIGKEHDVKIDEKSLKQAHRYVLLHFDEMKELLDEFIHQKQQTNNSQNVASNSDVSKWIINEYGDWLQNQVHCINASTEDEKLRKALAGGLNCYGRRMKGLMINGYKLQAMDRDCLLKTQNSGIMVEADRDVYFGKVKDMKMVVYFVVIG